MASSTTISGLANIGGAPSSADLLVVVDVSDQTMAATGTDKNATVAQVFTTPNFTTSASVTGAASPAFAVGRLGATTPAFAVDTSVASQVAGIQVTGAATGGTVTMVVTDSGSAANVSLNAKGTGTVTLQDVSTGNVIVGTKINVTGSGGLAVGDIAGRRRLASTSSSAFQLLSDADGVADLSINTLNLASNIAVNTNKFTVTGSTGNTLVAGTLSVTSDLSVNTNKWTVTASSGNAVSAGSITATTGFIGATNASLDGTSTGTVLIGSTSTGRVAIGRGVLGVPILGSTEADLGTNQNSTPTAAQLLGGYLKQTSTTGSGTITLPTGTNMSSAIPGVATGDSFECLFANIGSQGLTVTGTTGMTIASTTSGIITTARCGIIKFRNTGSNTWTFYVVGGA